MPIIVFVMVYITGVMLSFTKRSNIKGVGISTILRSAMFLKLGRGVVFIHTLTFQCLNILLFATVLILYFFLNENDMATVYNIYKWTSLVLFAAVLLATAVDAAVLERSGKGNNNENN